MRKRQNTANIEGVGNWETCEITQENATLEGDSEGTMEFKMMAFYDSKYY